MVIWAAALLLAAGYSGLGSRAAADSAGPCNSLSDADRFQAIVAGIFSGEGDVRDVQRAVPPVEDPLDGSSDETAEGLPSPALSGQPKSGKPLVASQVPSQPGALSPFLWSPAKPFHTVSPDASFIHWCRPGSLHALAHGPPGAGTAFQIHSCGYNARSNLGNRASARIKSVIEHRRLPGSAAEEFTS